jgi:galactonate dehydratase
MLTRRRLLTSAFAASTLLTTRSQAALAEMKITRVRYYDSPIGWRVSNQSSQIVTVETDQGITGIGEGGTKEMMDTLAGVLIGESPNRIEYLWQLMYRGDFYPPGREKIHALGALDMALWDIKGKALDIPVYELLGGLTRDYVPCYSTGFPSQGTVRDTARACMDFGFKAFRTSVFASTDGYFEPQNAVRTSAANCEEIRRGVGDDGAWAIDYHTRLDFADAVRLSTLLEPLEPIFCEDLVRSENPSVYRELRPLVKVPIAVGEHFADRWEINELVEQRLIDYSRVTIPNVGGITEMKKLATHCEPHYVGLIPHFTGPIAEASLVHVLGSSPQFGMMEMTGDGNHELPHLPECYDFSEGKMWPNQRPGLGVTFNSSEADLISEITEHRPGLPKYFRRDGSLTNW